MMASSPTAAGQLVCAELLALRNATPSEFPCISLAGVYKASEMVCTKACCIKQERGAPTPDGEDTPKWSATLSARMQDKNAIKQPDFGESETPDKTILPADYDPTSGWTPPGWQGTWRETSARCDTSRPGVPGHTYEEPFCLATPSRDKK